MIVYICAPINQIVRARMIARTVEGWGHKVISTWHTYEIGPNGEGYGRTDEKIGKSAKRDLGELRQADILLVLAHAGSNGGVAGEIAVALSHGADVWIIEGKEHYGPWTRHPDVKRVTDKYWEKEVFGVGYDGHKLS